MKIQYKIRLVTPVIIAPNGALSRQSHRGSVPCPRVLLSSETQILLPIHFFFLLGKFSNINFLFLLGHWEEVPASASKEDCSLMTNSLFLPELLSPLALSSAWSSVTFMSSGDLVFFLISCCNLESSLALGGNLSTSPAALAASEVCLISLDISSLLLLASS